MNDEVKYEVIAHMLVLLAICAVIVALFIFLWIIILKRKNKQAALMIVDIKNCTVAFDEMREALNQIGEEKGVQIKCQKEEIFDKMHRI